MPMSPRTLRPSQALFHPEAQDWRNRVIANGGGVSGTTLKAVSDFCRRIDSAGLRDRFYRLNLFAGTELAACLVPLYRGPSRTGTQFGGTTDTNNGPFVSGDYIETGLTGGLDPNGNGNKYLNTGYKPLDTGSPILSNGHLSWWSMTLTASRLNMIGARKDSAPTSFAGGQIDNLGRAWVGWGTSTSLSAVGSAVAPFFGTMSRRNDGRVYYRINDSAISDAASAAPNGTTADFGVFANIFDTGSFASGPHRMGGYSVGAELSAAQSSSLYSAWNSFVIALGRK